MINTSSSCLFEKITLEGAAKYAPEAFLQPKNVSNKSSLFLPNQYFALFPSLLQRRQAYGLLETSIKQENFFLLKMVRE